MARMAANTRARKNFGDSAERVAALHLEQIGYRILARNVRTRYGEIDIIAEDADGIAFVEVKARRTRNHGAPEEALDCACGLYLNDPTAWTTPPSTN